MSISFVIVHQINSYLDFTICALFANLLTRNVLNLSHSLANNPPLLLDPSAINTLEQKKVYVPITNWPPTYVYTDLSHLGISPIQTTDLQIHASLIQFVPAPSHPPVIQFLST